MRPLGALLSEAHHDVATKPRAQINRESAWRWATLAVAAYEARLFTDAVDYFHEAVEHAALCDPTGTELRAVRTWVGLRVPPQAL